MTLPDGTYITAFTGLTLRRSINNSFQWRRTRRAKVSFSSTKVALKCFFPRNRASEYVYDGVAATKLPMWSYERHAFSRNKGFDPYPTTRGESDRERNWERLRGIL